jgi:hypothetical protein
VSGFGCQENHIVFRYIRPRMLMPVWWKMVNSNISVGRRGVLRRASLAQDDNSSIAAENLRDLTPENGHLLSEVQHEPRRSAIAVLGGVEQVQMQVVA